MESFIYNFHYKLVLMSDEIDFLIRRRKSCWFLHETFHEQTNDELTEKELKQVEANDQSIYTILLGLREDIYAAVNSCETAQEIWLHVQQMMKGSDIGIQEKKAKLFNEWKGLLLTVNQISVFTTAEECVHQLGTAQYMTKRKDSTLSLIRHGFMISSKGRSKESNSKLKRLIRWLLIINLDEIEEVNANCILMANLQQASTSGTKTGRAPVYDSDGSIEINALHLSSGKQITTLNEEISNLSKQLSTEKSTVSSLLEEKKKLKSDFKIREDELLDKQIQLENKIKELDNILVKTGQSIQTMHMLSPKPDSFYHTEQKMALGYQNPFYLKQAQRKQQSLYNGKVLLEKHDPPVVHDSEETLQLAQESRQKMKQLNKEIKPANYTKINHLSGVFVSQTAKSQEEVYFLNTSKTATVSKSISIPNEEFLDDTTPSVARKFLNEVKSTIVTLQRVVKHRMTLDTHNWSSIAHQEIHKILKEEIFPIINQVDTRLQNFEIQFLKEAAKFVRDFKSLTKEADESLVKHKALELEIERLLRALCTNIMRTIYLGQPLWTN
ncbi:hypothetical protein Tco_0448706 [Tanacetum coccineum]